MEKSIGALWAKKSKKGNTFYSGNIEIEGKKTLIIAFPNTKKTKETQPDISIYKSEDRAVPIKEETVAEEEVDVKDIPF